MNTPTTVRSAAAFASVCITVALLAAVFSLADRREAMDGRQLASAPGHVVAVVSSRP